MTKLLELLELLLGRFSRIVLNLILRGKRKTKRNSIKELNEYFDKIIILSIKRNEKRLEFLKKQLKGLKWEVFWGVDGKSVSDQELFSNYDYQENLKYWAPLTRNYLACSLSHAKIYEWIVQNEYSKVLILEDDAIYENIHLAGAVLENMPTDWELIRFGYGNEEPKYFVLDLLTFLLKMIAPRFKMKLPFPKMVAKYVREHADWHSCTVAYALTLSGAIKLAKFAYPIRTNADHLLDLAQRLKLIKAYVAVPRIFNEASRFLPSSTKELNN